MKKHSSFLLTSLLSMYTSSFPMGTKDQKSTVENQTSQTSATATAANTTPEQPAKTITPLLKMAEAILAITEFSSNMALTKSEIIFVLDRSKVALKDLDAYEFTKTYIREVDELAEHLARVLPAVKEFLNPSAIAWAQKIKPMFKKVQLPNETNALAIQIFRDAQLHKEREERREKAHKEELQQIERHSAELKALLIKKAQEQEELVKKLFEKTTVAGE